jgi:hypothetical protein
MTADQPLEDWQRTTVPKPRAATPPPLGSGDPSKDRRPIPRGALEQGARLAQHARCVEHVPIDGLSSPVCVMRGQDRDAVIAEARELVGPVAQ